MGTDVKTANPWWLPTFEKQKLTFSQECDSLPLSGAEDDVDRLAPERAQRVEPRTASAERRRRHQPSVRCPHPFFAKFRFS